MLSRLGFRLYWKMYLAIGWLLFVVVLSSWWVLFTGGFIDEMMTLHVGPTLELSRKKTMVFYEGISLVVLLILGGIPFVTLVWRESERSRALSEFFSTFNHELKTSLASLRLQAEVLKEDPSLSSNVALDRLVQESGRLELQLENSLFVARGTKANLFLEWVVLSRAIERLQFYYPTLKFVCAQDAHLHVDVRAFDSILRNIVQNAMVHGGAKQVEFIVSSEGNDQIKMKISDDGRGFEGSTKLLGKPFARLSRTSGSGLGLTIVKNLVHEQKGHLRFDEKTVTGFSLEVSLPGRLV